MQTFTVEITNNEAIKVLQELQEKQLINILARLDGDNFVFPGKPLTSEEFESMVKEAENAGSIFLQDAKALWARQRKELLKAAR